MSGELKTTFDLEPNPFERSFASKDSSNQSIPVVQLNDANNSSSTSSAAAATTAAVAKQQDKSNLTTGSTASANSDATASVTSSVSTGIHQKPDLHIPNISSVNHQPNGKLPGITPPLFTPGGRRLPPLGLSPTTNPSGAISNPGTPNSNLWNSLLSATNNQNNVNGNANHNQPSNGAANMTTAVNPGMGHAMNSNSNFNQFLSTLRKTGLTPNESNIRSGLTPGGLNHQFSFTNQMIPGLTTPSALLNSPMTPGLSSLLGIANNTNINLGTTPNLPILNPQLQPQQHSQQMIPPPSTGIQIVPTENQDHTTTNKLTNVLPSTLEIDEPTESKESSTSIPTVTTTNRKRKKDDSQTTKKQKLDTSNATDSKPSTTTPTTNTRGKKSTKKETSKIKPEEPETMADTSQEDIENEPTNEKRRNFLERNRVAASKCRQRKKQLIQKMEDELAFYSTGYRELSVQVNQLRDQVINLKGIIVGHKDCTILASSVGGINNLNNIIQQANYITQVSASTQTNATSMPSTIPTTLNIPQPAPPQLNVVPPPPPPGIVGHALPPHVHQLAPNFGDPQQHQQQQQQPQLLSSASETPENGSHQYDPNSGSNTNQISLPSSTSGNGEVRLVNSMTNLQSLDPQMKVRGAGAMLQQQQQQGPPGLEAGNYNNLRPVNSMVDMTLQHQAANAAHYNGLNV